MEDFPNKKRQPLFLRKWWEPYPFEILYISTFLLTILALRIGGIQITFWTFEFTFRDSFLPFVWIFLCGVIIQLIYHLQPKMSVREYRAQIRKASWLVLWTRIWIACFFMTYTYMWVKISVPLLNWHIWDLSLWNLDILVHGGISPNRFLIALFENTMLLPAFDIWYMSFVTIHLYSIGFFCAALDPVLRKRFAFSQVMLWTLGVWLYVAIPAVGPIYAFPQEWSSIRGTMPRNEEAQKALGDTYQRVTASRRTGVIKAPFNPSYGVAAMPSLHVAALWLLFLWSRKHARILATFYGVGAILTWIASIVTGWHYAVDGYAGILLAQCSYWAAQRTTRNSSGEGRPNSQSGSKNNGHSSPPD